MAHFHIHFFKEKSRTIELDYLISFFDAIEGIDTEMDEASVRFNYKHPRLGYKARFILTPKSVVPDIYRLNPRYRDLNFHLEMPILTPYYISKHIFELVKKITETFQFHTYNELFEDVLPFKMEVVNKVFTMFKEAYIKKNPLLMKDYHLMSKEKLCHILRYLDDQLDLHNYYKEMMIYVPKYHFFRNDQHELSIGIEWKENTLTVFPPHIDYVIYRVQNEIKAVKFLELYPLIEKYISDVPGFIKGTKVMERKYASKVFKVMKKSKFTKVTDSFNNEQMKTLMDQ
jgi:hypothetical protein